MSNDTSSDMRISLTDQIETEILNHIKIYHRLIAAERERGSTLFLTDFTRPSLLLGTMYSRISICFCPDVVIPGEFRNLQVNLKNEGCVRTIFCAARACVLLRQFPCFVFLNANDTKKYR